MPNRVDSVVAHGAGVVHAVKARLHGLVGVFKTLSEQHGEAGALMKRLRADHDRILDLWPKIRAELTSHEKGELAVVFPVLRANPETRAFAERHDVEAKELSATIAQLNEQDAAEDVWWTIFDRLITLVEQHVAEEENDIFPKAQAAIGEDKAKELDEPFLTAKKQAMLVA